MKKILLTMLAAILTCSAMFTSCTNNQDNPVTPTPNPGPDEVGMFVQNVLNDNRYQRHAYIKNCLCLDVDSYEEAMAEFLKLLPEGVAATAFKDEGELVTGVDEAIGFLLNAPKLNKKDTVFFCKSSEGYEQMVGYAQVYMDTDIMEALGEKFILYLPSVVDDMIHFTNSFINIMPYCQIDPEDTGHLICTAPSASDAFYWALEFISAKMSDNMTKLENGDAVMPLTDGQGNSYGYMTIVNANNMPEGVKMIFLFDDDLKANMEKILQIGFSKLSFVVAPAEETPAEQ